MNLDFVKRMANYIPHSFGIQTRQGIEEAAEKAGITGMTLCEHFHSGNFIRFFVG